MSSSLYPFRHAGLYGEVSLQIQAAADLDALVTDETDPERIPYWAVVWDSAPPLARFLLNIRRWEGEAVLELGCGTGLVGLALAAAGGCVTQSDLFPEAVEAARRNAALNGLSNVRHLAADWRLWPLRQQWPVIVASDVLYERHAHGALLAVIQQSLQPGGVVYLGDPQRVTTNAFLTAAAADWRVETVRPPGEPGAVHLLDRR